MSYFSIYTGAQVDELLGKVSVNETNIAALQQAVAGLEEGEAALGVGYRVLPIQTILTNEVSIMAASTSGEGDVVWCAANECFAFRTGSGTYTYWSGWAAHNEYPVSQDYINALTEKEVNQEILFFVKEERAYYYWNGSAMVQLSVPTATQAEVDELGNDKQDKLQYYSESDSGARLNAPKVTINATDQVLTLSSDAGIELSTGGTATYKGVELATVDDVSAASTELQSEVEALESSKQNKLKYYSEGDETAQIYTLDKTTIDADTLYIYTTKGVEYGGGSVNLPSTGEITMSVYGGNNISLQTRNGSKALYNNKEIATVDDIPNLVPESMEVTYPEEISLGNVETKKIEVVLFPEGVAQNFIITSDHASCEIAIDGTITPLCAGVTHVRIFPTLNTALAREITITVLENPLRLVTSSEMRLKGTNGGMRFY